MVHRNLELNQHVCTMLAVREEGAEGRHVPALELAPILLSNFLGQRNKLPEQSKSTASGTERLRKLESAQACIITSEISGAEVNNYILLLNTKTLAAKA